MTFAFEVLARCAHTQARVGRLRTPHGELETPAFMPVGTRGSVKGLFPDQVRASGTRMLLANAYHLHLRPGEDVVRELGGLHRFMGWDGPILTDSGGYQVFSLAELTRVDDEGANVRSVVDGSLVRLTPERAVAIQHALGADVIMAFDHCAADPLAREPVEAALERTSRWLERCVRAWRELGALDSAQALFGIVQGGAFEDLRERSAAETVRHELFGYAIGGVSVGEDRAARARAVRAAAAHLPLGAPRYLMGVGLPADLFDAIERGVDLFDCVTPTRHGRNHQAFTSRGRLNLRNGNWRADASALDPECDCETCRRFSRAYLSHLARAGEMLAGSALSLHNLRFFQRLMEDARSAIRAGDFAQLRARFHAADLRA